MFREFAAENARRRDQANRDARLAWLGVAIWARTQSKSRVPPLSDYLVAASTPTPSPAVKFSRLRASLEVLSAQYGIPLRPRTPEAPSNGK